MFLGPGDSFGLGRAATAFETLLGVAAATRFVHARERHATVFCRRNFSRLRRHQQSCGNHAAATHPDVPQQYQLRRPAVKGGANPAMKQTGGHRARKVVKYFTINTFIMHLLDIVVKDFLRCRALRAGPPRPTQIHPTNESTSLARGGTQCGKANRQARKYFLRLAWWGRGCWQINLRGNNVTIPPIESEEITEIETCSWKTGGLAIIGQETALGLKHLFGYT